MELIEFLKYIFSGFWRFIGFIILLNGCLVFIAVLFTEFFKIFRSRNKNNCSKYCKNFEKLKK